MNAITITAFTDTGYQRSDNQDALLVGGWVCQSAVGTLVSMSFDPTSVFVCAVADGMGGHAGGDLASRIALGFIADSSPAWRTRDDVKSALIEASARVHQVGSNPDLRGLGTTIAGVCVLDDEVIVFNVGDSRVYGVNGGSIQQPTVDDAVLDTNGQPTHVITQSLGQREPVAPHIECFPRDGASYLICSDGVSGVNSPVELGAAVSKPNRHECARAIVDSTRVNGAHDNFSLLIVDIPPAQGITQPVETQSEATDLA